MKRDMASLGAADWLALAAAPTFAVLALLTAVSDDGRSAMFCGGSPSLLGGMSAMYILMATFHLAPWFRLTGRS